MTRRPRVLVASDGSPSASRAARALASLGLAIDANIRVLTVLSSGAEPTTGWGGSLADAHERMRRVQELVQEATAELVAMLEGAARRTEVCHRFGNPADRILEEVDEWGADLVVMDRLGVRASERWLLGSVSEHVSRRCKVPMLIVP